MKVSYIFRAQSKQRSIERVFYPIITCVKDVGHSVDVLYVSQGCNLITTLISNARRFAKISQKELCHITGDVQYVACFMNPNNTILTIHDLVPLHNKNVPWYSKLLCYWLWYYLPLKRLRVITCISETTRKDLLSFFPWAKNKIVVVPNPIDPAFNYVKKVFNAEYPRILHIGTKPNKNLLRVLEAVSSINCHLRIIGHLHESEMKALEAFKVDYSNEEFVTDKQIVKEYIECDIVSFPSLFEGFGMPIIEGQATGRVVITSDIEPMTAVAGGGAVLVDPTDVTSIRNGFAKVIADSSFREGIIERGRSNVQNYTVQSVALLYLSYYKALRSNSK